MRLYNNRKEITAALLGICAAVILWVTVLSRGGQTASRLWGKPFHTIVTAWMDIRRSGIKGNFLGNIIMFLPIGFLFPIMTGSTRVWKSLLQTAAAGFAFSLLIETLQLVTARGTFEVDDLILNTFGAVVGYGILRLCGIIFAKLLPDNKTNHHGRKTE